MPELHRHDFFSAAELRSMVPLSVIDMEMQNPIEFGLEAKDDDFEVSDGDQQAGKLTTAEDHDSDTSKTGRARKELKKKQQHLPWSEQEFLGLWKAVELCGGLAVLEAAQAGQSVSSKLMTILEFLVSQRTQSDITEIVMAPVTLLRYKEWELKRLGRKGNQQKNTVDTEMEEGLARKSLPLPPRASRGGTKSDRLQQQRPSVMKGKSKRKSTFVLREAAERERKHCLERQKFQHRRRVAEMDEALFGVGARESHGMEGNIRTQSPSSQKAGPAVRKLDQASRDALDALFR
eukprot:Clim_evm15s202 gene=Clim_evmTU15s202